MDEPGDRPQPSNTCYFTAMPIPSGEVVASVRPLYPGVVELMMGADQIAVIKPAVEELQAAAGNTQTEFVARFDIPGRHAAWTEVIHGTVNLAYPYADDPMKRLARLGIAPLPELTLSEWQPNLFATFLYEQSTPSHEVAKFVDCILGTMLGGGSDYEVDVSIERVTN